MKQVVCIFLLLYMIQIHGFCTYLNEANELLNQNKPEEARILYEKALLEDPVNEEIYLNLAIVYEMLGDREKSLEILKRGLSYAGETKYLFYHTMGNEHYELGRYSMAVDMYTKSIEHNSRFANSYMNRGNGKLKLAMTLDTIDERVKSYENIITDYETYLALYPTTPQRSDVEKLIAALRRNIKDKEQREKDLENLLDILNSATDSTKDITAGAEDIKVEYEDEDILE
ncbi:MAG: tetratricopeptide repeat protein [Spirochaetales bacterium]|nr:tetratricopeptide repeat protein [Spirochaetales bacterium]